MQGLLKFFKPPESQNFPDNESFFRGLEKHTDTAIRHLQAKIAGTTFKRAKEHGLPETDAQEIINDATLILLKKIKNGEYLFSGNNPATYGVEIAKNLILNQLRKYRRKTDNLETATQMPDNSLSDFLKRKEDEEELLETLEKIGQNCKHLLRLKYFDGYKDEEILELKLTQYSSIGTLKVRRSECLKKLTEILKS